MKRRLRIGFGRQSGKARPTHTRQLLILLGIATILQLPQAIPCNGSRTTTPTCGKTVVLTKVGPDGPILGAGAAGFFTYDVNIFARGSNFLPAPNCPQPTSVTVDLTLTCDPGPDSTGSSGQVAIGPGYTDIPVFVNVPAGPPRECQVSATATVTFSDGSIVTAVCPAGDRSPTVCIVAPIAPATPRLDIERLTAPVLAVHAGDVGVHSYRIKNNDPSERFSGELSVGSKSTSKNPEDTSGTGNTFGVSDPAGDAFAIFFADDIPAGVCPSLPKHPHLQVFREVTRLINLTPGQEIFVDLLHRPYGGCATGSCNESRVRLEGEFSDNTPGLACTNAAVVVDNSIPANIGACPGVGSVGQVFNVNPTQKIADFEVLVDPLLPVGGALPVRFQGAVNGFPGLQVQTTLLQEDNNESVRDVTTISDPGGNPLPAGAVLDGQLFMNIEDPNGFNQINLERVELIAGAPTGLSHLAPVVHAHLTSFPIDIIFGSPDSELAAFMQYGALGFPPGSTIPVPLPLVALPDGPTIAVRVQLPENVIIQHVELVCDLRFYGFVRHFNPPLPFQGNLVTPLGNATIFNDPASGHLTVSNIGSSGLDGVSIDLGDVGNGTALEWLPLPLDRPGTQLNLQATGRVEGNPNPQLLGGVRLQNPAGGDTVDLLGDFNPFGAQNILVQIFGGGRLVGTAILPPAGPLGRLEPVHPNVGLPQCTGAGKFAPGSPYPLPCFFWQFDRLGEFTFPGRGPMVGDRVALFAQGSPLTLEEVVALDLLAARIAQIELEEIAAEAAAQAAVEEALAELLRREELDRQVRDTPDEGINLFGNNHFPLGQAELRHDSDGRLTVSNIGSSGLDGVSIEIGETEFEAIIFPPVNLRAPGTAFGVSGIGTVGGIPGQGLGSFGCRNNNGQVQAVADFKALGIPNVVIELLLGGVSQGVFTVACGQIGSVTPGPGGGFPQIQRVGKLPPAPVPCYYIGTDRPINFTVINGPTVVCDEVRALADSLPEPLTRVDRVILRGTNLGRFTIGDETQPAGPIVTGVAPNSGTTGEKIIITGSGFGTDPKDLCAVIMLPGDPIAIPLIVESCTEKEICARIGAMPPGAPPTGEIMVARGDGECGVFEPVFPEIVVEEPVWVWDFTRGETLGGVPFQPIPTPAPAGTVWFEQPFINGNGELCLTFEDPNVPGQPYVWPDPCKVQINARMRDHTFSFGFDQFASCLTFVNTTTAADCARRICDSIRCAWFQQAGILVNCRVVTDAFGVPTVCLGFADGIHKVDWGTLSVCITELNDPVITNVSPATGTTGDIIKITGSGFGSRADNLCSILMLGNESVGIDVLAARDNCIIGRLGPVPPGAGAGQIMVARGSGRRGFFQPAFPDIIQEERTWVWNFRAGETAVGFPFEPFHLPVRPGDLWFFSGPPQGGQMCITLPRFDWDPDCKIYISARMRDHPSNLGHDHLSECIRFPLAGSFEDCLERICDTIRCSWSQLLGVPVICDVTTDPFSGTICIGFLPPFQVGWGNLTICIECPKPVLPTPEILTVDRAVATTGDVLRLEGLNFCTDGIDTSCLVGWWPLDWDACDFSGNCHHGSVVGTGVTFGRAGANTATGRSVEFEGTGHIEVPWSAALNSKDFTVSLWTKADVAGGGQFRSAISNRDDIAPAGAFRHGWILYNNFAGNWSFWNGGGPGGAGGWNVADDGPVAVGPWNHIAITYDSATNTKRIYVNGVLVSTTNPVAFSPNNGNLLDGLPHENEDLHIGGGGDDGTQFRWDGCIDDVSLWNKALSQSQIETIRRNSLPNAADLCLMQMDGTRANTFNVDSFFDVSFDPSLVVDVMTATLSPPRPGAQPGPLMIDKGEGRIHNVVPVFDDVTFGKKHWAWSNDPRVPGSQGPLLEPVPTPPGIGERWFYSEPPANGVMCIYIDGNWGLGSMVTVSGRMRSHSTGRGYDQFSSGITMDAPMTPLGCAERICDVISCTWSQLAGVRVLCVAEPFGNDGAKITLLFENDTIDWGSISICATDVNQLQTFDQWKAANGIIDDLDDGDLDGIPAIVEAYIGLDPANADVFDNTFDPSGMIMFNRDPSITGLRVSVETSINLIDYQTVAVNPADDGTGKITVFHSELHPRGFWRLVVKRW